MIDMNIKSDADCSPSDYNACPTIYLNDDQCEALGITSAPEAGTVYLLRCKAVAVRVTAEQEEADETKAEGDGPDISLSLQITEMELSGAGSSNADIAKSLYA